jgi:hypothetical protein
LWPGFTLDHCADGGLGTDRRKGDSEHPQIEPPPVAEPAKEPGAGAVVDDEVHRDRALEHPKVLAH